jgi:hypothetical protein
MPSATRADAGEGQVQRQVASHPDDTILRDAAERRRDPEARAETAPEGALHGAQERGAAVGERVGVQNPRHKDRDAVEGAEGRRLGEQRDVPARDVDRSVTVVVPGRAAPRRAPVPAVEIDHRDVDARERQEAGRREEAQQAVQPGAFNPFPAQAGADIEGLHDAMAPQRLAQEDD